MPLAMQGDKLLPGHQNIVRRSIRPGAPDRRRGDRGADAGDRLGQAAGFKFGLQRRRLQRRAVAGVMGGDVDQRALELLRVGMAEFEPAQFLEMIVQQPGMVERRLQDQRLARAARCGGRDAAGSPPAAG